MNLTFNTTSPASAPTAVATAAVLPTAGDTAAPSDGAAAPDGGLFSQLAPLPMTQFGQWLEQATASVAGTPLDGDQLAAPSSETADDARASEQQSEQVPQTGAMAMPLMPMAAAAQATLAAVAAALPGSPLPGSLLPGSPLPGIPLPGSPLSSSPLAGSPLPSSALAGKFGADAAVAITASADSAGPATGIDALAGPDAATSEIGMAGTTGAVAQTAPTVQRDSALAQAVTGASMSPIQTQVSPHIQTETQARIQNLAAMPAMAARVVADSGTEQPAARVRTDGASADAGGAKAQIQAGTTPAFASAMGDAGQDASSQGERAPAGTTMVMNATTMPSADGAADSVTLSGPPTAWRQSLQEALGERLQLQVGRNAEQAVIRLEPPMLGQVEISIRHSAGALEVHISATHHEVLRQLQAVSENLRSDLAQRQFTEVAVNVSAARAGSGAAQSFGSEQQGRGRGQGDQQDDTQPGMALAEAHHASSAFSLNGRA